MKKVKHGGLEYNVDVPHEHRFRDFCQIIAQHHLQAIINTISKTSIGKPFSLSNAVADCPNYSIQDKENLMAASQHLIALACLKNREFLQ